MSYRITRRIEIDAGHRISTHGSKCRHLHGHRYAVEAVCEAAHLHHQGEQTGMVLDFGFVKEEMVRAVDEPCDHGFIASLDDVALLRLFAPPGADFDAWRAGLGEAVAAEGFATTTDAALGTRLYVVPFQPTAECLARHWFERLEGPVRQRSGGLARLVRLTVWETPNCRADYAVD